jgi:hypothetical protein
MNTSQLLTALFHIIINSLCHYFTAMCLIDSDEKCAHESAHQVSVPYVFQWSHIAFDYKIMELPKLAGVRGMNTLKGR